MRGITSILWYKKKSFFKQTHLLNTPWKKFTNLVRLLAKKHGRCTFKAEQMNKKGKMVKYELIAAVPPKNFTSH